MTLYRHSLKAYPGAVCIDGTPAEYYSSIPDYDEDIETYGEAKVSGKEKSSVKEAVISKDDSSHTLQGEAMKGGPASMNKAKHHALRVKRNDQMSAAKNYVIFLEGGGYCHEASACKWRCGIAPWLCTASGPKTKQGFGILSDSPIDNPSFHDYFKVDVPYCTGDMYIGRRDGDETTLSQHFKGRVGFDAIIMDLQKTTAIDRAVNVVLGGSSAGGAGVAFNCNHLKELLPHANVWCIVDAAFFYPVPGPLHNTSECDSIDRVLALSTDLWQAPEVASFDLHGPWWRNINPNLLIATARFDRFGLESYCANLSSPADLRDWEAGIVEKTMMLQEEDPQVSFFMPACLQHMMLTDTALYSRLRVGAYGLSYSEALWWWINGRSAVHVWDTCPQGSPPFCNPQCWHPTINNMI